MKTINTVSSTLGGRIKITRTKERQPYTNDSPKSIRQQRKQQRRNKRISFEVEI